MKIVGVRGIVALGVALAAGLCAHATTTTTYAFSCLNTQLSLTPVSFSLPVVAPAANATGGAIGKVTYGPLTIEALIDNQYLDLFHDAVDGTHFQTCQLIETVTGPSTPAGGGTVTYVWTFKTVYVGSVTAIGSDTANADSTGRNAQTGLMQVTFVFVSVTPTIGGAAA